MFYYKMAQVFSPLPRRSKMARNKAQLQRLIFVDRMIRDGMKSGKLANCSSIAADYEVSYKSIMRDIDYLKYQCDAPIEYDPKRHGFYYTEELYQLPAISINESDLFAICIAEKALRQYENTPVYRKLASVFRKIEQSLPVKTSFAPSWVDDRISVFNQHQTDIDPEIWETVTSALRQGRVLQLDYLKPGAANQTARKVEPYHVTSFQGEWYLVGFCHQRQEIRTFAISRIKEAEVRPEEFSVPDDFDFAEFGGHRFGIFRGDRDHQVRISFTASHAPYVIEREWHPEQVVKKNKDGSVVLSFPSNHLLEVKRWVLSWGSGAKALAPPELTTEVRQEIQKTLQAYD